MPHRLVADHVGRLVRVDVDHEHHQPPLRATVGQLGLDRGAADEVVVELEVAVHARFERRVDRPVLAVPRAEVLLEPHRDQRPEPEQAHVERLRRPPRAGRTGSAGTRVRIQIS